MLSKALLPFCQIRRNAMITPTKLIIGANRIADFLSKADMNQREWNIRFGPEPDI